jgi:hypothetical protein
MIDADLLEEIRRVREQIARECDFDVHKIAERMRLREDAEKKAGVPYVSNSEILENRKSSELE